MTERTPESSTGSELPRPSAFTAALGRLAPLLAELGFTPLSEHYDHAAFGSALAVFGRRDAQFRVVWDGKEQFLRTECRADATQGWIDIESPSGTPEELGQGGDADRLAMLREALEFRCGSGRTRR